METSRPYLSSLTKAKPKYSRTKNTTMIISYLHQLHSSYLYSQILGRTRSNLNNFRHFPPVGPFNHLGKSSGQSRRPCRLTSQGRSPPCRPWQTQVLSDWSSQNRQGLLHQLLICTRSTFAFRYLAEFLRAIEPKALQSRLNLHCLNLCQRLYCHEKLSHCGMHNAQSLRSLFEQTQND